MQRIQDYGGCLQIQRFKPSESLKNFGVHPVDPGYLYVIKNRQEIKAGRSINPVKRMREAKTWIPDAEIVGVKPFWSHRYLEQAIHIGLASFWKQNEWYDFAGDEFFEQFLDEFRAFSDEDINRNSINFGYMMNGTGMAEFTLVQSGQNIPKRKFLRETTQIRGHQNDDET